MPIAIVPHKNILMPVVICDSCGRIIKYQYEGIVLFAGFKPDTKYYTANEIYGDHPEGVQPYFAHKGTGCVQRLEATHAEFEGHAWSMNIGELLNQVNNNCPPYRVDLLEAVYGEYPYVVGHEGCYVYVVWDFDEVIYVGKTTKSVRKRLNEHIKQKSPLGLWLEDNFHYLSDKHVHIYSCDEMTLDSTERYYIQKYKQYPSLLNIQ